MAAREGGREGARDDARDDARNDDPHRELPLVTDPSALARNVRLYPAFAAATGVLPWLPVFFLYFTERVGFDEALTLGAVYYAAVVALEVPSGWFSDRVGRRPTLLIACLSLLASYGGFFVAESFFVLALCQTLLAGGIAFQSGSDSALLHDSLAALGRRADYERAEARARVASMTSLGVSCLVGGVLGSVSLAWPYALAAVAAVVALVIAWRLVEPPVHEASESANAGVGERAATTVAEGLADPVLRWLLCWYVLAFALAHVPYEFQQPWIRLLGESGGIGAWFAEGSRAPMVSGLVAALSMFGGAFGATLSVRLSARLGLSGLLALANVVQIVIVGGLALALHPVLLVLVFGRGFAMSMAHAPLLAAIAPRIASSRRATWLSLQSLAGRLGLSLVLFALADAVGATLDWPTLARVLVVCAGAGSVLALLVWWFGPRAGTVPRRRGTPV